MASKSGIYANIARITPLFLGLALVQTPQFALAEPSHGLAMHGSAALEEGVMLTYVSAEARHGGSITIGEVGRFDSLHPYIVKGRAPSGLSSLVFESLMTRNYDEPFSVYGLLAKTIETDESRSWVTFCLEPDARFSNGSPVRIEDVVFSMETLREKGRPNFRSYYKKVTRAEKLDASCVRFVFEEPDRELPLLLGLMPILSQEDWAGKDFSDTTLTPIVGSGPYAIESIENGVSVTLRRRSDYWGRNKPITQGLHNPDTVKIAYFRDEGALWEAFKAGLVHLREEHDPAKWQDGYDFPAAKISDVIRDEIDHSRATGMHGFVFNTRRDLFSDRRVRDALTFAYDFDWINAALHHGAYERIRSYYANSRLGFDGPAQGRERELLAPFGESLPAGTLDHGYAPPSSPGQGRNRENLRRAGHLLDEAGWLVRDGIRRNTDDVPLEFEILLQSQADERVAGAFRQSLKRLGIDVTLRLVSGAEYQERLNAYDYDMIVRRWWLSLSPGAEQRFYFGSDGVTRNGTRNYMGADHPAIDAMIDAMLAATSVDDYRAAVRALDRVLVAGRYVIPFGFAPTDRLAWWKPLAKPDRDPLYGYRPEVWWIDPEQ